MSPFDDEQHVGVVVARQADGLAGAHRRHSDLDCGLFPEPGQDVVEQP